MPINFNGPTTADAYTTVPTTIRDHVAALGSMLDPAFAGTLSNTPAGTKRFDSGSALFQQWNGTAWAELTTGYAKAANAALTGNPTAPTQAVDNNSTRLATTAFVIGQRGTATPAANGTASAGTSLRFSSQDHVHPTDTSRAPLASPAFTGNPTAPTQAAGNNTTRLATTAFVQAELADYAPLESPVFGSSVDAQGIMRSTSSAGPPASGVGLEMFYSTGAAQGYVQAYDRTGAAYRPLSFRASSVTIQEGTTDVAEFSTAGAVISYRAYTPIRALSYAASLSVDARLSNIFRVNTLTGNVTTLSISNAVDGQFLSIRFKQDATGGRTVAAPAGAKIDGAISTAPSRTSYLNLTWNAVDGRWEGNWFQVPA